MSINTFNQAEVTSIASILQEPAEKFGNDPHVEMMWAIKAYEHAETYFNIIISVDPNILRLSSIDDKLYNKFKENFAELNIELLTEEILKSNEAKEKWRQFCGEFEGQVVDWNMATLLRLDASKDISEENTIIVPRIQFLAIEITRNRDGLNSELRNKFSRKLNK